MRTDLLLVFLIFLLFGCRSEYNNSPATQQPSEFSQGKLQLMKSSDGRKFGHFVGELAHAGMIAPNDELQNLAKVFFPDSTIHEDHYLQGRVLNYRDSFHIIYYEYSLDEPDQSNMYIGSFTGQGDAVDVLAIKEVSFDGSITINLIDAEILEVQYYDFFKPRQTEGTRVFTSSQQPKGSNWYSQAVKNYDEASEIVELFHFENFRVNTGGGFEQLSRPDSVNLQRQYPHASIRVFTLSELNEYGQRERRQIINEIYASHGFIFRSEELARQFEQKPWYRPAHQNIDALLSGIEKLNIQKIVSLEQEE